MFQHTFSCTVLFGSDSQVQITSKMTTSTNAIKKLEN